jgi:cyclic beta-1,2-glucan synthetase
MAPAAPVEWRGPALHLLGLALATAAVFAAASGGTPLHALLVALLAGGSGYAVAQATGAVTTAWRSAVMLAVMAGLIAWAIEPTMRVWQAPPTWAEALATSPVGGGLAVALLLGANLASGLGRGRPLGWREAMALSLLPFLFTSLFLLSSAHLLADIGRYVGVGRWFGWYGEATFGRIVLLFLFNEIAIVGGGWLIDGHWTRSWRLRALLLLSAAAASLTPQIASFGAGPHVADLPRLVLMVLLPLISAAALAGLWAQTFLLTGLMLDAMYGRRPAVEASIRHWREGAVKGAIYSFVFMLLVQLAGLAQTPWLWPVVSFAPALAAILAGTLLYPLGRTIIESFDGSSPFSHAYAPTLPSGPDSAGARGRLRPRCGDPGRPA